MIAPYRRRLWLAAALVLVANSHPVLADEDAGRALLVRAVHHYAGLPAYAAKMEIDFVLPADMGGGGMPTMFYEAVASRDDRAAFRSAGGPIDEVFVQDAERQYVTFDFLGAYMLNDAVPLASLLDAEGETGVPIPGAVEFLSLCRVGGEPGSLLAAEAVVDAGEEEIDGTLCRRLEMSGGGVEGTVWIETGGTPWVARWRFDPETPASDRPQDTMMGMPGLDIVFTDWDPAPDLAHAFDIEIDESYRRRDTMPTAADYALAMGGEAGRPHPLLDQPVPAMTLATLDGGELNLAELKGRVVVLDFWATWCQPCLMALPGVIEVTSELADRGVTFWTVNQREKPDVIRSLLAKKGWTLPVALDPQGKAGSAFHVQGIPFTVVIDREGVVRHVHRGFMPGQDVQLRQEILSLVGE